MHREPEQQHVGMMIYRAFLLPKCLAKNGYTMTTTNTPVPMNNNKLPNYFKIFSLDRSNKKDCKFEIPLTKFLVKKRAYYIKIFTNVMQK